MTFRAIKLDSARLLGFDQAPMADDPTAFLAAKVGDKQSGIAAMAGPAVSHPIHRNLGAKVGIKTR